MEQPLFLYTVLIIAVFLPFQTMVLLINVDFSCAVCGVRHLMGLDGLEGLVSVPVFSGEDVNDGLDCAKKYFSCTYCRKNYWNKADCLGHINSQHLKRKPYICKVCSVPFSYKQSLKRHEQSCLAKKYT